MTPTNAQRDRSFTDLYQRTLERVLDILYRRGVVRIDERREVAQDVYVIAYRKLPALHPAIPREAWILGVADNVARNHVRKRVEQLFEGEPMDPSPYRDPERAALFFAWYRDITKDIEPDHLHVFELHELEKMTVAEVAATMRRPQGTIKTWIANVRQKLSDRARRRGDMGPFALPPFGTDEWHKLFHEKPEEPGEAEELWNRICRELVRGGTVGAAAAGSAVGMASKAAVSAWFAGGAVLGAGVMFFVLHLDGWSAPRSMMNDSAPLLTAEGMVPAPPAAPSALASASATAPLVSAAPSVAPAPLVSARPAPGLDPDEMRLIEQAQAAHARGDVHAAQHAVNEHARRFPSGAFRKDRESLQRLINERRGTMDTPDAGRRRIFGDGDEE